MSGTLAFLTEFFLRFVTLVALPLVLIVDLLQPNWWLLWLGVGLTIPALTQILCYRLAVRILRKARRVLSTVPPSVLDDSSLKNFGQWGISLFCYIIVLFLVWVGLQINFLHDVWAYTFVVFCLNVVILCCSKSIIFAPDVRGSLCRAFTLGERLEHL